MRRGAASIAPGLAVLVTVGAIVVLVTLLFDSDDYPERAAGATLADITEARGKYLGRQVTVTNRIDEIVTPRTFTFEADPGNKVVVVARRPLETERSQAISDGDRVRVTGRVTTTGTDEFGRAYDPPGEGPEHGFGDAPAIVDAEVTRTPSRLPADPPRGADQPTRIVLEIRPRGPGGPTRRRKVSCSGHERGTAVCRRLQVLDRSALRPVPGDAICTQIYGGPATALIRGRLRGEAVSARFSLKNGCQIDRWKRFSWLLGEPPDALR